MLTLHSSYPGETNSHNERESHSNCFALQHWYLPGNTWGGSSQILWQRTYELQIFQILKFKFKMSLSNISYTDSLFHNQYSGKKRLQRLSMRTLKFKAQPTNGFFAIVNQMFGGSSQLPTLLSELCATIWFDYRTLGSSRKLGGAAQHLIDGSENRICRLSFEF